MLRYDAPTAAEAAKLMEQYRSGSSFFFSSPRKTLLTHGEYSRLSIPSGNDNRSLPERVEELLGAAKQAGRTEAVVVGAIPFNTLQPTNLFIPLTAQWYDSLQFTTGEAPERPQISGYEVQPVPGPTQFKQGVDRVLELIRQDVLQKAVLSRTLHIHLPQALQIPQILYHLAYYHAHGYTFAVPLLPELSLSTSPDAIASTRTLFGASPELLVTKKGLRIQANPLAGSAARSEDPVEDERRAAALLSSAKDRYEHAVVIDAVAAALQPYCSKLDVPPGPSLIQTKAMWHLSTEINGVLKDDAVTSLDLALAMHPTPAICGTPSDAARNVIQEIEPFDRGFYSGAVGWLDANGDGEWAVTIRCAETEGQFMRVFAGAGIVTGSDADAELAETSAKFRTILAAMGLNEQQPMTLKEE
ncbi:isochorismate synthase DhbC [Paenibacillus glucanolyticus]|uniref:isochorismate synthase DhbC n=1 Tax=Paenibacillus glucanolyticus TaxID=59843 RepID=UPI00096CA0D7|nr:isochorismate synthase DhbC [Paenibacillus glucanolyticus]OMF80935.1 isochorismate synthase [Paenibacillus glucanolyticus]